MTMFYILARLAAATLRSFILFFLNIVTTDRSFSCLWHFPLISFVIVSDCLWKWTRISLPQSRLQDLSGVFTWAVWFRQWCGLAAFMFCLRLSGLSCSSSIDLVLDFFSIQQRSFSGSDLTCCSLCWQSCSFIQILLSYLLESAFIGISPAFSVWHLPTDKILLVHLSTHSMQHRPGC